MSEPFLSSQRDVLREALASGDPARVSSLVEAGTDIRFQAAEGYDALLDAVHGRDVLRDPRLMELLSLLVAHGVSVTGMSSYGESGVRVLSRLGRFDAVRLLLDAGANPTDIQFSALHDTVAFGALADVQATLELGADLEARDFWERTPFLLAIQTGDIAKARFLREQGARRDVTGRCGKPPLFYAIENHHAPMLRWLLESGESIDQTDEFSGTALADAVKSEDVEAVRIVLDAGADVLQKSGAGGYYTALYDARTRDVALTLLEAGADPQDLSPEGRRAILGYSPEPDETRLTVTVEDYRKFRDVRFGTRNPERMTNPFWEAMTRSGVNAYRAIIHFEGERDYEADSKPVWCVDRLGQSLTLLLDGRIVQIAGEHEDSYDPDFCIYNDVFVHDLDGSITIYGYPEDVFPPTDFHTATLIDENIYLIGSLGYSGTRQSGVTPVYRLNAQNFRMERLKTSGAGPGWISRHRAILVSPRDICVRGGKIIMDINGVERYEDNDESFALNVETLTWTKGPKIPNPKEHPG